MLARLEFDKLNVKSKIKTDPKKMIGTTCQVRDMLEKDFVEILKTATLPSDCTFPTSRQVEDTEETEGFKANGEDE